MDLRPYGLDLTLTPSTDLLTIGKELFAPVTIRMPRRKQNAVVEVDGLQYEIMGLVGEGAFANTYSGKHNGTLYAIKEIHHLTSPQEIQACVIEILTHIILLHESMGQPNGPYVPHVYKVGYDFKKNMIYMVTELMSNTVDEMIAASSKKINDTLVPFLLFRLANILEFFGNRLHFNHRDLHTGNIMLSADLQRVVLIDFGYSCLTWKGLKIIGPSLYNSFETQGPCFKPDRDLAFLIFRLFKGYSDFLSDSLLEKLHKPLQTIVGNHQCDMGVLCPEHGLATFNNHYEYLDRENVTAPYAVPAEVRQQMVRGLAKARTMQRSLKPCASGSVRNPKTRRCVTRTGRAAKSFTRGRSKRAMVLSNKVAQCADKPGYMYNVRTESCVPIHDTEHTSLTKVFGEGTLNL